MATGAEITDYLLDTLADRPQKISALQGQAASPIDFALNAVSTAGKEVTLVLPYTAAYYLSALSTIVPEVPWLNHTTIGVEISPLSQVTDKTGTAITAHTRLLLVIPNGQGEYATYGLEADPTHPPINISVDDLNEDAYWGDNIFAPVKLSRPLSDSHFVPLKTFKNEPDLAAQTFYALAVAAASYNELQVPYAPLETKGGKGNCHSGLSTIVQAVGRARNIAEFQNIVNIVTATQMLCPNIDRAAECDIKDIQEMLAEHPNLNYEKGITAANLKDALQYTLYQNTDFFPRTDNKFNASGNRINNPALIPAAAYTGMIAVCVQFGRTDLAQQFLQKGIEAGAVAANSSIEEATSLFINSANAAGQTTSQAAKAVANLTNEIAEELTNLGVEAGSIIAKVLKDLKIR